MNLHRTETLGGTGRQLPFMLGDPTQGLPGDSRFILGTGTSDRSYRKASEVDVREAKAELEKILTGAVNDRTHYNYIFDGVEQETIEFITNLQMAPETWLLLNLFRKSDPKTAVHTSHVAALCYAVGRLTGISQEELSALVQAGLLHDYWKIGCPLEVLHRDGPLTDEEWKRYIVPHPEGAVKLLREHNQNLLETYGESAILVPDLALTATLDHHAYLDPIYLPGERLLSYPVHEKGYVPHILAQLLKVLDSNQTQNLRRKGITPREAIDDQVRKSTRGRRGIEYSVNCVDFLIQASRKDKTHPRDNGRGNPDRPPVLYTSSPN